MWILNTICWKNFVFSTGLSRCPCRKSGTTHVRVYFRGSPFCCMSLSLWLSILLDRDTPWTWDSRGRCILWIPVRWVESMKNPLNYSHTRVCNSSLKIFCVFLLQFSRSVMSGSLQPCGLQHTTLPCPSATPRACSNSWPLSRWCHPTISSSVVLNPPAPNPSQHQSLFQWLSSSHQMARVLEFQLQHQSFHCIVRTDFL